MTSAIAPEKISRPIAVSTNATIDGVYYTDAKKKTPKDISAYTTELVVWIRNSGANSSSSYTATIDDDGATASLKGTWHIDLTGANHTVEGDAQAHVYDDGVLKGRFTVPFVAAIDS